MNFIVCNVYFSVRAGNTLEITVKEIHISCSITWLQLEDYFTGFPLYVNAATLYSDSLVFPSYSQISKAEASETSLPGGKTGLRFLMLLWLQTEGGSWGGGGWEDIHVHPNLGFYWIQKEFSVSSLGYCKKKRLRPP